MTTVLSESKTGRSHYENGDDLPGRMVPPSVIFLKLTSILEAIIEMPMENVVHNATYFAVTDAIHDL